jgi:hypothetical protein
LLSLIATCGKNLAPEGEPEQLCGALVKCTGSRNRRAYCCMEFGHVRRNAPACDELVAARVIALLELDAPNLLKPAPKVTADTGALRAEARKLETKRDDLARLLIEEILTEAGTRRERQRLDARLGQISAELAASDVTDPLPEFRDPDASVLEVWDGLGLARQRAIVKLLYTIEIMPVGRRGGNRFDPDSVRIVRKA